MGYHSLWRLYGVPLPMTVIWGTTPYDGWPKTIDFFDTDARVLVKCRSLASSSWLKTIALLSPPSNTWRRNCSNCPNCPTVFSHLTDDNDVMLVSSFYTKLYTWNSCLNCLTFLYVTIQPWSRTKMAEFGNIGEIYCSTPNGTVGTVAYMSLYSHDHARRWQNSVFSLEQRPGSSYRANLGVVGQNP